jgi:hypothetical protein
MTNLLPVVKQRVNAAAALVGSRKGPYERGSGVTPVEQRGLTENTLR